MHRVNTCLYFISGSSRCLIMRMTTDYLSQSLILSLPWNQEFCRSHLGSSSILSNMALNHINVDNDNQIQQVHLIMEKFNRRMTNIYGENDISEPMFFGSSSPSKLVMKHNSDFQQQIQFAGNLYTPPGKG
ncbi:hypothetical protein L1987_00620 [Smallanthus sonchifolius]|uniref:Uncharacterized protein n=1 Tax=Smallanthus sonchifolius TaxID=185202 RepID=A0ACB9K2U5_9ASTR|nr:hypothetical protein L1987_00620 [Smallanthus sonchifolius]